MKKILIILIFLTYSFSFGQKKIFHEYFVTASDIHIEKWNIDKNNLPNQYVEETIDNKNRVIQLKFYRNGSLEYNRLCYLSVWVKYEYPNDNTIISYYLNSNGIEDADFECGMPSKTIFYLSTNKRIILESKSEFNIDIDFYLNNGWNEKDLKDALEFVKSEKHTDRTVSYFSKSFYKMNKIFPISDEFEINDFLFVKEELEEIRKCLYQ